ncbi:hypothetical protein Taro_048422 [Colocasia esculenta]|uniref:Uncharacterized protein n=1 Tax=Colocasia esculenta TaxID=4460 RepID=A0A843WVS4_COLES|nr:hypothetical protein [Colocasia esculenta]
MEVSTALRILSRKLKQKKAKISTSANDSWRIMMIVTENNKLSQFCVTIRIRYFHRRTTWCKLKSKRSTPLNF